MPKTLVERPAKSGALFNLSAFVKRDNLKLLLAVGNDGTVYALEKLASYNRLEATNLLMRITEKHPNLAENLTSYYAFANDFFEEAENCGIIYYGRRNPAV